MLDNKGTTTFERKSGFSHSSLARNKLLNRKFQGLEKTHRFLSLGNEIWSLEQISHQLMV